MKQIQFIIIIFLFQSTKACLPSSDDSTSIICSNASIISQLSSYTNLTQLSLINAHLIELPDLSDNQKLTVLHLDNNKIQLITRNYSSIEYLYLTSNHIYALHLLNLSYPKLKLLDLSHNPIEHIVEDFFSIEQFPRLEIVKLTNSLKHINPYLIDNRFVSFSSLRYLQEIYFDENDFDEFSCSKNITYIQWNLSSNLKKLSLGKNRLDSFDPSCFAQIPDITEVNLEYNLIKSMPSLNFSLPYLSKLRMDYNSLVNIPSNLFESTPQLNELDLSANQFNWKPKKLNRLPNSLKILHLNSVTTNIPCSLFDNLNQLEELHLADLSSTQIENCIFRKLTNLKILDLRNHRLKTIDEQIFRPLLTMNQFDKLDISSHTLLCDSCSLRWLNDFSKTQNKTEITCLDRYGQELLINTLNLSPCASEHSLSMMILSISISISILVSMMLCIYTYQHRKFPFSKFSSVYHMIPLQNYDRIYQSTTEDITNDHVMLVT